MSKLSVMNSTDNEQLLKLVVLLTYFRINCLSKILLCTMVFLCVIVTLFKRCLYYAISDRFLAHSGVALTYS